MNVVVANIIDGRIYLSGRNLFGRIDPNNKSSDFIVNFDTGIVINKDDVFNVYNIRYSNRYVLIHLKLRNFISNNRMNMLLYDENGDYIEKKNSVFRNPAFTFSDKPFIELMNGLYQLITCDDSILFYEKYNIILYSHMYSQIHNHNESSNNRFICLIRELNTKYSVRVLTVRESDDTFCDNYISDIMMIYSEHDELPTNFIYFHKSKPVIHTINATINPMPFKYRCCPYSGRLFCINPQNVIGEIRHFETSPKSVFADNMPKDQRIEIDRYGGLIFCAGDQKHRLDGGSISEPQFGNNWCFWKIEEKELIIYSKFFITGRLFQQKDEMYRYSILDMKSYLCYYFYSNAIEIKYFDHSLIVEITNTPGIILFHDVKIQVSVDKELIKKSLSRINDANDNGSITFHKDFSKYDTLRAYVIMNSNVPKLVRLTNYNLLNSKQDDNIIASGIAVGRQCFTDALKEFEEKYLELEHVYPGFKKEIVNLSDNELIIIGFILKISFLYLKNHLPVRVPLSLLHFMYDQCEIMDINTLEHYANIQNETIFTNIKEYHQRNSGEYILALKELCRCRDEHIRVSEKIAIGFNKYNNFIIDKDSKQMRISFCNLNFFTFVDLISGDPAVINKAELIESTVVEPITARDLYEQIIAVMTNEQVRILLKNWSGSSIYYSYLKYNIKISQNDNPLKFNSCTLQIVCGHKFWNYENIDIIIDTLTLNDNTLID